MGKLEVQRPRALHFPSPPTCTPWALPLKPLTCPTALTPTALATRLPVTGASALACTPPLTQSHPGSHITAPLNHPPLPTAQLHRGPASQPRRMPMAHHCHGLAISMLWAGATPQPRLLSPSCCLLTAPCDAARMPCSREGDWLLHPGAERMWLAGEPSVPLPQRGTFGGLVRLLRSRRSIISFPVPQPWPKAVHGISGSPQTERSSAPATGTKGAGGEALGSSSPARLSGWLRNSGLMCTPAPGMTGTKGWVSEGSWKAGLLTVSNCHQERKGQRVAYWERNEDFLETVRETNKDLQHLGKPRHKGVSVGRAAPV